MCGIFGYSFDEHSVPSRLPAAVIALSAQNDGRGGHAWGWAGSKEGTVKYDKGNGTFVANADFEKMCQYPKLFGHARYATMGARTADNAHPYIHNGIIGAHNGQVYNYLDLDRKYPEYKPFKVDSQYLIALIADGRLKDFDIEGYGAVEFIDLKNPNSIFVYRAQNGELAVADVLSRRDKIIGTMWSSNAGHLKRALTVAGLKYTLYNELKAGVLHQLTPKGAFMVENAPKLIFKARWSREGESYACYGAGSHTFRGGRRDSYPKLHEGSKGTSSSPSSSTGQSTGIRVQTSSSIAPPAGTIFYSLGDDGEVVREYHGTDGKWRKEPYPAPTAPSVTPQTQLPVVIPSSSSAKLKAGEDKEEDTQKGNVTLEAAANTVRGGSTVANLVGLVRPPITAEEEALVEALEHEQLLASFTEEWYVCHRCAMYVIEKPRRNVCPSCFQDSLVREFSAAIPTTYINATHLVDASIYYEV